MKTCAGGILTRDGKILLGLRAPDRSFYPGVWDIIGGHSESGESPRETLTREIHEELGIRLTRAEKLGVLDEPQPEVHGPREYHIFAVTQWSGGDPRLVGDEHSELGWFTPEEAARLDLAHPGYVDLFRNLAKLPSLEG